MKIIFIVLTGIICILSISLYSCKKNLKKLKKSLIYEKERAEINNKLKEFLAFWLRKRSESKFIITYLKKKNIKKIAIYGMAELGIVLCEKLKESEIEVKYGIDIKADLIKSDIPIIKPEQIENDVDAVVVTPICFFEEIYDMLSEKLGENIPIIGLDEIIYSIEDHEKE